jgi:DNA-binding response OmpR family regulator/predicted regulator of Ras-like GTPase activity (Roadblock/LC7/MglB family)
MEKSPFAGKTVLIADDDFSTLITLQSMLEISGYNVLPVENGQQAFEQALARQPDLILSDVMMPEMDGLELCQEVKHHPKTRAIPIVLLTALGDTTSILRGFQAGAVDYLTKPFDMEDVRSRVDRVFSLSRQQTQYLPEDNDSIEEIALIGFLRLCHQEQVTGIIHVTHSDETGQIHLKDGQIVETQLDALLETVALETMLAWKWHEGYFNIEQDEADESELDQLLVQPHQSDQRSPTKQEQPSARKEVISMATKTQQLKEVLDTVKAELTDAESIAIVASDGTIFASTVTGTEATRVGAMIATIVGLSRRACQSLKRGAATEALLRGTDGFVAIYPAGPQANLGVTTKSDVNLGMLNLVCREAADKIQNVLG